MATPHSLEVELTRDRFEEPLVIIETGLGDGRAMSPHQLRELAAALLLVATAAEARPTKVRHFSPTKRTFPI